MKKNVDLIGNAKIPRVRKLFMFMKLTTFLILISVASVWASKTYSQTKTLNLNLDKATLKEVLSKIEDQSDFVFMFSGKVIDINRKVSINAQDQKIEVVLNSLFAGTNVEYTIKDRIIVLSNSKLDKNGISTQPHSVSGKVTDPFGAPLPGVTVTVKGTVHGTITDINGSYTLTQIPADALLQFSFVGMKTQEVPVFEKTIIDIKMEEDAIGIEEVVAIGYGIQKKVNLTGAVSSVTSKSLENRPITNVSSALSGLSSGVFVKQGSGKPGSDGASIVVRGLGTLSSSYQGPLVLIDGILGNLDDVNPNDIESISVLKDAASAAIYGSRAANGVILVTTKKGQTDKVNVLYSGNFSLAQPSNLYNMVSDYADRMGLLNESYTNLGENKQFTDEFIKEWRDASQNPNEISRYDVPNWLAYPNTDWNDVLFKNNIVQNHNLSVSGGAGNANYLLSFGYLDNPGLMDNTGMKRYQIRANVESKITKFLTVGTQTFGLVQNSDTGDDAAAFTYFKGTIPSIIPFYDNRYGGSQSQAEVGSNPYHVLMSKQGDITKTSINTTWYGILDLFKGLSIEGRFNYQTNFGETTISPNADLNTEDRWNFATNTIQTPGRLLEQMTTYYEIDKSYNYTSEALVRYINTFAEVHDIEALVGFQQYYFQTYNNNATKQGLISPDIYTFGSAKEMVSINGSKSDYATRSLFGRINYAYKSKYLFEGNFRYDGTSKFSTDNRWGFFPSFSAGWRLSEEEFMANAKRYFQNLKLRVSWGQLGNVTSGYYDYQSVYGTVGYALGNNIVSGLRQSKVANSALHWENVNTVNIGLDISTLDSRLNMEMDWYNRLTEGILTSPPIHLTMGVVDPPTKNTASVLNRGTEITFTWKDKIGKVNYSVSGNFAYNYNEVTKYQGKLKEGWITDSQYTSNLGDVSSANGSKYTLEEHIINEHYLYERYHGNTSYQNSDGTVNINGGPKDGMIRTPEDLDWIRVMQAAGYKFGPVNSVGKSQLYYGDFIYADLNGDGIYGNTYDRSFTNKSESPKYIYGFNLYADWNGFDLSMQWAGSAGMYYFWHENYANSSTIGLGFAIPKPVADNHYYYNESKPDDLANNIFGKYPRMKRIDSQNNINNDFWLYDASYLKLKNLQIGYSLPRRWLEKIYINRLRVYVSGENLLTITSYPGLDPEIGASIEYPTMRRYALGINVSF